MTEVKEAGNPPSQKLVVMEFSKEYAVKPHNSSKSKLVGLYVGYE